jgi:hypothetical protein
MPAPPGYVIASGDSSWDFTTTTGGFMITTLTSVPAGDYGSNPLLFAGIAMRPFQNLSPCSAIPTVLIELLIDDFTDGGSHRVLQGNSYTGLGGFSGLAFYAADSRINDGCTIKLLLNPVIGSAGSTSIACSGVITYALIAETDANPIYPGLTLATAEGAPTQTLVSNNGTAPTNRLVTSAATLNLNNDPVSLLTTWMYMSYMPAPPTLTVESEAGWYQVESGSYGDMYAYIGIHTPTETANYLGVSVAPTQPSTIFETRPECLADPQPTLGGHHGVVGFPLPVTTVTAARSSAQVIG